MLVLGKEDARNLSKVVNQSDYILDAYVSAATDGGSLVDFHDMIDGEEEKLVISLLAGNAVIEQISGNQYAIVEKNAKQSSVETNKDGIKVNITSDGTNIRDIKDVFGELNNMDEEIPDKIITTTDRLYVNNENSGKETTVVVYTNNAQTLVFHCVDNFQVTSTGFGFDYTGKATGVTRHAVFNNSSTAGYAIAEEKL